MSLDVSYALVAVGLLGGLAVLSLEPLPGVLNLGVAAALLGVGFGAILFMIARGAGPGGRGPEF